MLLMIKQANLHTELSACIGLSITYMYEDCEEVIVRILNKVVKQKLSP